MKGMSKSRIITLLVYLVAVALSSGAVAYGQYCYGSSQWLYAWSCNDFYDGECATYGPWVVCQEDWCSVSGCGSGVARRCVDGWDACYNHYCGSEQCV